MNAQPVHLHIIPPEDHDEARLLAPRVEQERFVLPVHESLERAAAEGGYPVGIYAGGTLVGFFTLRPEGRTAWLQGFFIDQSFQRRGYARAAVQQIPAFIGSLAPNSTEIATVIHTDNFVGEQFYTRLGFQPTTQGDRLVFRRGVWG